MSQTQSQPAVSAEHPDPELTEDSRTPQLVIEARQPWSLAIRSLWKHRELLFYLVWRDVKLRYKQTFFGAGWALIQPILLMGVFGLFFGRLAGLPSDGLPYPIFVLAGLVPFFLFSNGLAASARSVVASTQIVSKVYFPRLILPVAAAAAFLVDFVLALAFLVVAATFWGIYPTWRFVLIPPLTLFALLAVLGMGIWFAALNVRYRDVVYTVPFVIQAMMFASPIGYPSTLVPANLRVLYGLNPLAGVIEGFRWASVDASTHPLPQVLVSLGVTLVLLLGALVYFGRTESSFADVI